MKYQLKLAWRERSRNESERKERRSERKEQASYKRPEAGRSLVYLRTEAGCGHIKLIFAGHDRVEILFCVMKNI